MNKARLMVRGLVVAAVPAFLAACGGSAGPTGLPGADLAKGSGEGGSGATGGASATGNLRLRCEVRPNRSKISVDGRNLAPRNGTFSARVEASGGTAVSGTATAVGDEVEFDFDSNRDDVAAGATQIAPNFIAARSGPDVVAQIRNAQGEVVASASAECEIR